MNIRQLEVSEADVLSARVFFKSLFSIYDLGRAQVLDAFARNGQLTVNSYVHYLADPKSQLECWELGEEHKKALEEFTPNVRIGCSYKALKFALMVDSQRYDLLVVDTPQGLHQDCGEIIHAEHFDFLRVSLKVLKPSAVLVLYVNKRPYNRDVVGSHGYDEYQEYHYGQWMRLREKFYGFHSDIEEDYILRYRQVLGEEGLKVKSFLSVPCFSDVPGLEPYAFRLGLQVEKL